MPRFGFPHRHYRVTDSTNERARELVAAGAPGGTVVSAEAQTAGRGRRGREWAAPPGGALLYSAILRPLDASHALLPIAVPVAACEAIEAVAPVECRIKWPNDVWIDGRKVAGVLIEGRIPDWAVIGVGVNVAAEPAPQAIELRWPVAALGGDVAIDAVRRALDRALGRWVAAGRDEVLRAFSERDALRGRSISWTQSGDGRELSGTAHGVDGDGNLVVVLPGGERTVLGAGEVSLALG